MNQMTILFLFHGVKILSQTIKFLWIVCARQLCKDVENPIEKNVECQNVKSV